MPCEERGDGSSCAKQTIVELGRKLYRRPLSNDEVNRTLGLYTSIRTNDPAATFDDALGAVISAMLQSPHFLYRIATVDASRQLDPYAIANRGKMFAGTGAAPALAHHGLHPLERAGVISRE